MSFDTEKVKTQRKAFTVVEFHLDKNDPALDATFALQPDSYGTPKTTDNPFAYTGTDFRVYRYSDQQLFGIDHFPYLIKAKTNPPRIDPGKSIGFRATGTISLLDFNEGDEFSLPPPYDDRRVFGSHAEKMISRNHLINRRAKIIRGFGPFEYSESNAQVENYLIDSFTPTNERGQWSVNVVDELILVETKKSKAPEVSKGELSADITDTQLTLAFTSEITDEYGAVSATGKIAIEKEIMDYVVTSSTAMSITRGIRSEKKSHKSGETIQKCIVFDDVNIIDIITQLITDHTKIPTSYIPTADWAALKAGDLANFNLTNILFKPDSIEKHLNDLIELAGLSMFVDVIEQELVIVTTPDFATPVITFDETEHLIQGLTKAKPRIKKQITRQTIHWNKTDITQGNSEENYSKHFQVIDGIVEGDADESVVSEGKALFSNWIINTLEDNNLATNFVQRNINRFSKTPVEISGTVDQKYIGNVAGGRMWLGSIFNINTSKIRDGGFNNIITTCQCISLKPSSRDQQWDIVGLSYVAAAPIDADLYIDTDKVDYLLTDELTDTTESKEYVVVINSSVTVSASSPSLTAFTQGSFTNGSATLKIFILGRIIGAGGDGGDGGTTSGTPSTCSVIDSGDGDDGGDALSLTTNTVIDNGFGFIGGGGGGSSGKIADCEFDSESGDWIGTVGADGGGGQGKIGGLGNPDGTTASATNGGGLFGQNGDSSGGGTGGTSGVAIQKNGNTVTIISGNNSEQIKGLVI